MRSYRDLLRPYEETLAKSIFYLLQTCPETSISTRKELLVATRHIIATDFRNSLKPFFERIFDENLLCGANCSDSLKPLALSVLADFVQNMKEIMRLDQISIAVRMYTVVVNDWSLPFSIQTLAVRLLYNLAERISSVVDITVR